MPLIYPIIAPLIIISSVAVYQGEAFTATETARLLQNCMLIAGIGTLLQLYPIWKIGSGLPVVMGISFTFLAACLATASQDYGIMVGALAMILGGLFPPIGAFFTTLPDCVLGGCTVIMFGSIMMSGVRMMHDAGMDQRNTLIAATSICLGVGVTQVDGFFNELPSFIGDIFAGNMVAGVFVVGLILDLCLPRDHSHYTSMWHKFLAYKKAPEKIPQEPFLYTTQCTGVSTPKRSLMTWRGQTTAHAPQLRQRAASITAWNCSISGQFFTHRPQAMQPYAHRSAPSSSFFARQPPLQ